LKKKELFPYFKSSKGPKTGKSPNYEAQRQFFSPNYSGRQNYSIGKQPLAPGLYCFDLSE